ncbi:immune inhibitor A, partial [candidate division WOR-3 bacterium]|nr:immune inhibitor A [candidate division WOR-3 bacterium]
HSGDYSITDSPDGPYDDESLYYLQSPELDLTDKAVAELSFWHLFSIEKGWDWGVVEAKSSQTDGWVTLKRFSGFQEDWREERFDLSGFCGSSDLQIRFRLTTDRYEHFDGWYVDDVVLTAFKGKASSGLHELADIRPVVGPVECITTGNLSFAGPAGTQVDVVVFDASGRLLARTEGTTPFSWQMQDKTGSTLPAGVYFVRTISDTRETNRKVVVVD